MSNRTPITSQANHVEQGFMDARAKVIDIAAFLDRVQRANQESDYRVTALRKAIQILSEDSPTRAQEVLLSLSDPTEGPIPKAHEKGAAGAWPGSTS